MRQILAFTKSRPRTMRLAILAVAAAGAVAPGASAASAGPAQAICQASGGAFFASEGLLNCSTTSSFDDGAIRAATEVCTHVYATPENGPGLFSNFGGTFWRCDVGPH
jgi:hypothetical protein